MDNQVFAETLTPTSWCQVSASRSPSKSPMPDVSPNTLEDDTALWEPTTWDPNASLRFHRKKKPANHIPRPPNAFILFRSYFIRSQHVSSIVEPNHSTLSKIIGMTWKGLSDAEKEVWFRRAKKAGEDHKKKWPKYTFRPIHGSKKSDTKSSSLNSRVAAPPVAPGNGGGGRRIREVEPTDDARCKKIANLLSSGLRGADLDDAIREFDQNHVPPVVTRFEAPLTAEEYANGTRKVKSSTTAPTYSQTATAASISTPYLPLRAPSLRTSSSSPDQAISTFSSSSPACPPQEDILRSDWVDNPHHNWLAMPTPRRTLSLDHLCVPSHSHDASHPSSPLSATSSSSSPSSASSFELAPSSPAHYVGLPPLSYSERQHPGDWQVTLPQPAVADQSYARYLPYESNPGGLTVSPDHPDHPHWYFPATQEPPLAERYGYTYGCPPSYVEMGAVFPGWSSGE